MDQLLCIAQCPTIGLNGALNYWDIDEYGLVHIHSKYAQPNNTTWMDETMIDNNGCVVCCNICGAYIDDAMFKPIAHGDDIICDGCNQLLIASSMMPHDAPSITMVHVGHWHSLMDHMKKVPFKYGDGSTEKACDACGTTIHQMLFLAWDCLAYMGDDECGNDHEDNDGQCDYFCFNCWVDDGTGESLVYWYVSHNDIIAHT